MARVSVTVRWAVAPDFWTCSQPLQATSVPRTVASATGRMRRMVVAVMANEPATAPPVRHQGAHRTSPETSVPTLNPVACVCQVGEDRDMRRVRWLALCVATGLVVLLAVAVAVEAARRPAEAVGDGGAGALVLQVAAGVALWFAGLLLALRLRARDSGWLLAAAGPALLAGALPLPRAGGAVLFVLALALGLTAPALAGAAALLHPTPAHRRDPTIAGAAVAAAVAAGLVPAVLFDPRATGCFECPRNLLLLHGDAGLHDALLRDGLWVSAVACAVVAGAAALGLAQRPALVRRVAAPVVVPALVAAGLGAAMLAHDARAGSPALDATTRTLWLLLCGALLLAAAGVASEAV